MMRIKKTINIIKNNRLFYSFGQSYNFDTKGNSQANKNLWNL